MQPGDVTMYGRDYSATDWEPEVLDRYERENPSEPPVDFLGRYIGYSGNRKCISHYPGLYRRHLEHGRPSFLFHQIGYSDMGGGYDAGRAHAKTALDDAKSDRVGWDGESHIVACMDRFYAKPGYVTLTRAGTREYMRGFRSVLGDRSGYYGFYDSMAHAVEEGWASFFVQCGARSAHINGIHAWQENNKQPLIYGVGTDILELYCDPAYAFGGIMALTEKDADLVVDRLLSRWLEDKRDGVQDSDRHPTQVSNALWSSWHTIHYGDPVNHLYPSNKEIYDAAKSGGVELTPEALAALGEVMKSSMSAVAQSAFRAAMQSMEGVIPEIPGKIGFTPKPIGQ